MQETGKPSVNKKYLLQKIQGKGGWTFAEISEVQQDKHSPFGWVKVKGSIDGFLSLKIIVCNQWETVNYFSLSKPKFEKRLKNK